MRETLRLLVVVFLVMVLDAAATEVTVVNLPTRGALSLTLTPVGKVEVERQPTISRIKIEIEKIGPPDALAPAMNAYVVWAISPEGTAENIGELALAEGKGKLETVTRLDRFGLLITAEPYYLVDRPSAAIAFVGQPPRETAIRRTPVQVETGRYSYAGLKAATPPPAGTIGGTITVQARAALEIARMVGADRLAEDEFKLARVALDTMEEMLARANLPDVVLPAAHDAIRRAARATTTARDAAAGRDSGFRFGEDLYDKPSGSLTQAGVDAVQRLTAAFRLWSGPLRIRCSQTAIPIVRRALTQAGIPEDRLVFITTP